MKNAMLFDEFCELFKIPSDILEETPRMSKDQSAILAAFALQRIDTIASVLADLVHAVDQLKTRIDDFNSTTCGTHNDY